VAILTPPLVDSQPAGDSKAVSARIDALEGTIHRVSDVYLLMVPIAFVVGVSGVLVFRRIEDLSARLQRNEVDYNRVLGREEGRTGVRLHLP
jgi:hypothetical protein